MENRRMLSELHKKEYAATDFNRQVRIQDSGLADFEIYYIRKYMKPNLPTLDIGTGGGRIAFALEKTEGYTNITAIDFVEEFVDLSIKKANEMNSDIKFRSFRNECE